ncbi:MAG TPA: glycerol-3-phosphate 1-O-acyltransferase PlsY [Chthoniobacterales bacterium]|jgi:glycerol-3-phosphate acyltransferase PlsY
MAYVLIIIVSYFLGSIPNGYLVGRARGIDIRTLGSGNIGATNVLRQLGKSWGYLVFFLDALKGILAVAIAMAVAHSRPVDLYPELLGIAAALSCILGHTYPVWLGFRGGKGVATSAGTLLGLMPIAVISVLIIWATIFFLTRYVSLASLVAAFSLPIFVAAYLHYRFLHGFGLLPFSLLIAAVVIWRHHSNIRRLLQGTEPSFNSKR